MSLFRKAPEVLPVLAFVNTAVCGAACFSTFKLQQALADRNVAHQQKLDIPSPIWNLPNLRTKIDTVEELKS